MPIYRERVLKEQGPLINGCCGDYSAEIRAPRKELASAEKQQGCQIRSQQHIGEESVIKQPFLYLEANNT